MKLPRGCRSVEVLAVLVSLLAAEPLQAEPPAPAASVGRTWLAPVPSSPTTPVVANSRESPGSRSAIALLLVASLGGAAFFFARQRRRSSGPVARARIEVLGSVRVGPKALAVVTQVEGRTLLLGVTESSVVRLAWLGRSAGADHATSHPAPAAQESEPPGSRLNEIECRALPPQSRALPQRPATPTPHRRFRDLLTSALGQSSAPPEPVEAAAQIAAETQDHFTRTPHHAAATRIEGQAAGLAARFQARDP